jgi:hypothetical protein
VVGFAVVAVDLVVEEADQAVAAENDVAEDPAGLMGVKSSSAWCGMRWKTKSKLAQPTGPAMAASTESLPSLAHPPGPRCRAGTYLVCLLHVHRAPQRRGDLLSETTTAPPVDHSPWTPMDASTGTHTEREPPSPLARNRYTPR